MWPPSWGKIRADKEGDHKGRPYGNIFSTPNLRGYSLPNVCDRTPDALYLAYTILSDCLIQYRITGLESQNMPVYVYECKNCGSRSDKVQSFSAAPLTECENCGQGPLRRVFQPVGVIFKGSGWYITDSRKSESTGSDAKSSGTDAAAKSDKSDKSDDAKPAGDSSTTTATTPAPAKAATSDTASAD